MAAIDPDETAALELLEEGDKPRATLKLVRPPPGLDLDDSDEDDDDFEDDSEEDSDDEEINGGPSDKEKARKLKAAAVMKEMEEAMLDDDEEDSEDAEIDLKAAISKLIKGKAPATDDDEEDDEEESLELDENVVCTLDPERVRVLSLDDIPMEP